MEGEKIKEVLKNYKNKPNKDLEYVMDYLQSDFEKTKELIIQLTKHLDITEKEYNKVYNEYKKRMNV
jgi:sulfite reductase alpha subunit-like flavoprotein